MTNQKIEDGEVFFEGKSIQLGADFPDIDVFNADNDYKLCLDVYDIPNLHHALGLFMEQQGLTYDPDITIKQSELDALKEKISELEARSSTKRKR